MPRNPYPLQWPFAHARALVGRHLMNAADVRESYEALQLYVKFRLSTVSPGLLDDLRHYIADDGDPPLCHAYEHLIEFALSLTSDLMRRGVVLVPPLGEATREYTGRAVLDDDTFAITELLRETVFHLSQLSRIVRP